MIEMNAYFLNPNQQASTKNTIFDVSFIFEIKINYSSKNKIIITEDSHTKSYLFKLALWTWPSL